MKSETFDRTSPSTLGILVPRLHVDDISPADIYTVVKLINDDEMARNACRDFGFFASEVPEGKRREHFVSCFQILLSSTHPPDALEGVTDEQYRALRVPSVILSPAFVSVVNVTPVGPWKKDIWRDPSSSARKVSMLLLSRIRALEEIWLLKNYAATA